MYGNPRWSVVFFLEGACRLVVVSESLELLCSLSKLLSGHKTHKNAACPCIHFVTYSVCDRYQEVIQKVANSARRATGEIIYVCWATIICH